MNRDEIVVAYLTRLDRGDRVKLTTEERDFLVQDFVERLGDMKEAEDIERLCRDEVALLERGYGVGTNSTVNYLSRYRTAIASATEQGLLPMTEETSFMFRGQKRSGEAIGGLQHLAYDLMRYHNATYLANRKQTNVGNNARQDNPQPFVPNRYLEKAAELLRSEEPETLAVGIAAVTGRRHTEVAVSGSFSATGHPYLLSFGGQLKKANPIAYTILTLLPAKQVLEAIDRFRRFDQVQDLAGLTSAHRLVAAFRARVNTRVKQQFQETNILPLLPGFQSVSVHRLRAAYARLAIHFWLPGQGVNEQRWLQFYLGHVAASQMRDAANSNSTSHYFGYCLVDETGKPITVTGIKLMANPLPGLTEQLFQQQQQANDQFANDLSDPELNQLDRTTSENEEKTMSTATQQVEAAGVDVGAVEAIAARLDTLPQKQPQQSALAAPAADATLAADATPATDPPSKPKRAKARFRELRVNLSDLMAAVEHLGIDGGTKSTYQSLIDYLLLAIPTTATAPSIPPPAAPDPSELLAPLLHELSAIKQQVAAGQAGGELEQLRLLTQQQQQQIDLLQNQLNETQIQLQAAHDWRQRVMMVLQGGAAEGADGSPDSGPTLLVSAPVVQSQPQVDALSDTLTEAAPTPGALSLPLPQSMPPRPQPGRPPSGKRSPSERVPLAIAALMHHNQHCSPSDRWFLSGNVIAAVAGANPALVVSPWLEAHPKAVNLIDTHNRDIGLNSRSNGKDKDRGRLKALLEQFMEGKSEEEAQNYVEQFG